MPGIKELKTRIKSISGTRKVTRAMQMVSAAKMRKSQDATMKSRSYASSAWEMIMDLSVGFPSGVIPSESDESRDPLTPDKFQNVSDSSDALLGMTQLLRLHPKATKIAVLILTTNRGMVGSLNSNLLNLVKKTIDTETRSVPSDKQDSVAEGTLRAKDADIITYGRKGRDVMVRSHKEVLADFEKFDRAITTEDIFPISELITKLYSSGKYQKVLIFYNHFVSTLLQKPTVKQLLPFASTTPSRFAGHPSFDKEGKLPPSLKLRRASRTKS
jgi:F-type H+-transporting ATPase subunit gamma